MTRQDLGWYLKNKRRRSHTTHHTLIATFYYLALQRLTIQQKISSYPLQLPQELQHLQCQRRMFLAACNSYCNALSDTNQKIHAKSLTCRNVNMDTLLIRTNINVSFRKQRPHILQHAEIHLFDINCYL